jgi:hypothetical protein
MIRALAWKATAGILLVSPLLAQHLFAQEVVGSVPDPFPVTSVEDSKCRAAAPVAVYSRDGRPIEGLSSSNFEVRVAGHTGVFTLSTDRSSKRMLLLMDASQSVNREAWRLATHLAIYLAQGADPENRVALVVYGAGDRIALDFTQPRSAVLGKLAELASTRPPNSVGGEHLYDALLDAAEVFGDHGFGDAIFVIGAGEDRGSHASAGSVKSALVARRVRLFGLLLDAPVIGSMSGFFFDPRVDFYLSEVDQLAVDLGGVFSHEDTKPPATAYKLTDIRLKALDQYAEATYWQIAEPYRLDFDAPTGGKPARLEILFQKASAAANLKPVLLYPRQIAACGSIQP